jgi:hypothetical protein
MEPPGGSITKEHLTAKNAKVAKFCNKKEPCCVRDETVWSCNSPISAAYQEFGRAAKTFIYSNKK